jgi:phage terminase large subunit-like protein
MDSDRLEEQRRRLPEASYRRLFLNEWTEAEDRLTTIDDLQACVTLDGPQAPQPGNRYVIGLDLGLKADLTAAVVCHLDDDTVVLDRINTWTGTSEQPVQIGDVETWLTQASATYHPATVILDPWQAIGLAQRLKQKRIRVDEYTFSAASVGRLATTVHLLLREHRFALPQDPQLLDELANVRLRETSPGVYRMDHDPDKHDDQAIALALAANHLITQPQKRKWAAH